MNGCNITEKTEGFLVEDYENIYGKLNMTMGFYFTDAVCTSM